MTSLAARAHDYLAETVGVATSVPAPWAGEGSLPYFLRDAFDVRQLDLLGHTVLLALERNAKKPSMSDVRLRLDKLRSLAELPSVYVTPALASYERKRLIEQKVSFMVPGNQLYLPDLGIDLREYFRQRQGAAQTSLSPSAQAMLITGLLRSGHEAAWNPAETAAMLGYTAMTLSRTVRELVAAGLMHAQKAGRSQQLSMAYTPRETWERAKPLLRSPVQRTVWAAMPIPPELPVRVAGLSALAHVSMLAEPRLQVFAIRRAAWQASKASIVELPEAMPGACELQLWNYTPTLQPEGETVDPLSLMLSLQGSTDERVQSALDALRELLPW